MAENVCEQSIQEIRSVTYPYNAMACLTEATGIIVSPC